MHYFHNNCLEPYDHASPRYYKLQQTLRALYLTHTDSIRQQACFDANTSSQAPFTLSSEQNTLEWCGGLMRKWDEIRARSARFSGGWRPEQTFKLVAPRAKLSPASGERAWKMLCGKSASELVKLLAIPVRQSKPSSEKCQSYGCAASTGLVQASSADKYAKHRSAGEVLADAPQHRRAKTQGSETSDTGGQPIEFSALPTEIHRLIFAHIELVEDVVCLGLTSRYFWAVGEEVHARFLCFLPRAVGGPEYCLCGKRCRAR